MTTTTTPPAGGPDQMAAGQLLTFTADATVTRGAGEPVAAAPAAGTRED